MTLIPNVKRDALGFGIPVFETTAEAQRQAWPPRRVHNSLKLYRARPNLRALKEQAKVREARWRSNSIVRVDSRGGSAGRYSGSLFIRPPRNDQV